MIIHAIGSIAPLFLLVGFSIVIALYFLPTIIAARRNHHNRTPITLVNIFLGWTFLGWVISLVWSFSSPNPAQVVVIQQPQQTNTTL